MITVTGKFGISAKVLLDSISEAGIRFITFEIEYPRIILAELNTHRGLSKNSSSSRAIPTKKMFEQLTGRPVRFGGNVSGMQDNGSHTQLINDLYTPEEWWDLAKLSAKSFSQGFSDAGYHKQISNRITETFQKMKTVISGTEWANYFWLRNHTAADPSLGDLASCMFEAYQQSTPTLLRAGQWHLPYVSVDYIYDDRIQLFFIDDQSGLCNNITIEDAIKVSCARTAAVSFRNEDYGLEKCIQVYERLVGDERKHASAMEHAATPMKPEYVMYPSCRTIGDVNRACDPNTWQDGISHMDHNKQLWSGNLRGWIQHRKTIRGENYAG